MKNLEQLINDEPVVRELWENYLNLHNYVDDKMVEGCEEAEEVMSNTTI